MTIATRSNTRYIIPAIAAAALSVLAFTGCATAAAPEPNETEPTSEPTDAVEEEEEAQVGLEGTDFGNLDWIFRPGGNVAETAQIELVDGKASDGLVSYELGETVLSDLTSDGRMDAAVQITRLDGNAIDDQWYLWVATDDGPTQVTLPVARMARCGTVTHSVTAVETGGVQIEESRRHIGEDSLACVETGSDERTRIVQAIEARNVGEWWPVQTGPVGGFGGLCPTAAEYETLPYEGTMYMAPDAQAAAEIGGDGPVNVFTLEPWPIYGEPFPGWVLVGVKEGDTMNCAWAETP